MTPEEDSAFRAESRADEVYAIHLTFFLLSIISVLARLAAARVSGRRFTWDDWLAIASLVFIAGVFTGTMLWLRFGLGRHEVVVQEEDPMNIVYFYQTIFANEILYPFGLATARLSLVVLYHRIFGLFNARYYLYGLMAFIMAWAIYATLPLILACNPVSNFWTNHKNCIDISKLYISIAVGSIITDFILIILPMPYAAQLRMSWYKKMLLLMSFVFGGLERSGQKSDKNVKDSDPSTEGTLTVQMAEAHELDDQLRKPRPAHRTLEEQFKDFDFGTTTLNDLRRYGRASDFDD
ncbi:hypothetical protein CGCF415_v015570 [Colletotrichum fructicola]|uniref:Rhodopsin domain-containing protein n=1 Tax=Colletotrichum siamense TaxID=690259 RepID=A0A9P5BW65_COLSI|nr:hypothetical protein CGCSCA5_v014905 [Colletotrichum siamense]KAF4812176.1 hypothetical protein CGCTS75_v014132 [Colletotrichum tropicale]KAF4881318.1 hypothetical protein CGCFRS4_v015681 [Colletotrichum fructicola]KAF4836834.1 hypothetical protein CGCSCA4_v012181 [Colletotrichum siamense]KAF4850693.1 hypothetical protein CGCSCA2_v011272 [Colletotrichum siamense]